MTKLVAQSYKVKIEMIIERESVMSAKELKNRLWFPNFIVLRQPVAAGSGDGTDWQGYVKAIKRNIDRAITKQGAELKLSLNQIQKQGTEIRKIQNEFTSQI